MDASEPLTPNSMFYAFLAIEKNTTVEFDIYNNRNRKPDTNTQAFRRGVGHILTLLLQTGYEIKAKRVTLPYLGTQIQTGEQPLKF